VDKPGEIAAINASVAGSVLLIAFLRSGPRRLVQEL
jgi:hypothetical protein